MAGAMQAFCITGMEGLVRLMHVTYPDEQLLAMPLIQKGCVVVARTYTTLFFARPSNNLTYKYKFSLQPKIHWCRTTPER